MNSKINPLNSGNLFHVCEELEDVQEGIAERQHLLPASAHESVLNATAALAQAQRLLKEAGDQLKAAEAANAKPEDEKPEGAPPVPPAP